MHSPGICSRQASQVYPDEAWMMASFSCPLHDDRDSENRLYMRTCVSISVPTLWQGLKALGLQQVLAPFEPKGLRLDSDLRTLIPHPCRCRISRHPLTLRSCKAHLLWPVGPVEVHREAGPGLTGPGAASPHRVLVDVVRKAQ